MAGKLLEGVVGNIGYKKINWFCTESSQYILLLLLYIFVIESGTAQQTIKKRFEDNFHMVLPSV